MKRVIIASRLCGLRFGRRYLCTPENKPAEPDSFVRAFERFKEVPKPPEPKPEPSFAAMLRNSKLMQLGNPEGTVVVGKVVHRMEDDLYIDFGGKFNCVCKRPRKDTEKYQVGASVILRLHDLELSSRFLGSNKDLTLLEADATLLGLYRRPGRSN